MQNTYNMHGPQHISDATYVQHACQYARHKDFSTPILVQPQQVKTQAYSDKLNAIKIQRIHCIRLDSVTKAPKVVLIKRNVIPPMPTCLWHLCLQTPRPTDKQKQYKIGPQGQLNASRNYTQQDATAMHRSPTLSRSYAARRSSVV